MILLAHPQLLWLLPLAAVATAWGWRGRVAAPRRRAAVAVCRLLMLAMAVLAAVGPAWVRRSGVPTRVVVQDVGPYAAPADPREPQDDAGGTPVRQEYVAFADRAGRTDGVAATDAARQALRDRLGDGRARTGVALADALRLAGALVPPGGRGEVVLASPGLAAAGDADAEAQRLARRGIRLRVATGPAVATPPLLAGVDVPASATAGDRVRAVVRFRAAVAGDVTVEVRAGGQPPVARSVRAVAGENRVACDVPVTNVGATSVGVRVGTPASAATFVDSGVIDVRPAAEAVLVSADGAAAVRALSGVLGDRVRLRPLTPAQFAAWDGPPPPAVVLDDVPVAGLAPTARQRLGAWVAGGTGLFVTGVRGFGPGGATDAPGVGDLLPVEMKQTPSTSSPASPWCWSSTPAARWNASAGSIWPRKCRG